MSYPTNLPGVTCWAPNDTAWAAMSAAIVDCQAAGLLALETAVNPHLKSNYADLTAVWQAIRSKLCGAGLALVQPVGTIRSTERASLLSLTTMLVHQNGATIAATGEYPVPAQANGNNAQLFGSALTYARRYGLCALLGVATGDDDDAEKARPSKAEREGMVDGGDAGEPARWWEWSGWADHVAESGSAKGRRLGDLSGAEARVFGQSDKLTANDRVAVMARMWAITMDRLGVKDKDSDEQMTAVMKRLPAGSLSPDVSRMTLLELRKLNLQILSEEGAK